jgi:serine O-acetyltransferase
MTAAQEIAGPAGPEARPSRPPHGSTNQNPPGMGLLALLREDLATHDGNWLEPGFLAVAVHRFGNWRMGVRFKPFRAPMTFAYRLLYGVVEVMYGISLPYPTRLGRRVRIWHHSGIILNAHSIGDDVHLRQNTTLGLVAPERQMEIPTIGDRVDVGCGACILGAVTVGDDCKIGANAVVTEDVPAGSIAMGIPARIVPRPGFRGGRASLDA